MKMIFATLLLTIISTHSLAKVDKAQAKLECRSALALKNGERPTKEQRKLIKACLEKKGVKFERQHKKTDKKKVKAMKECRQTLGITKSPKGQRLDPASKEALKKCLKEKGITGSRSKK